MQCQQRRRKNPRGRGRTLRRLQLLRPRALERNPPKESENERQTLENAAKRLARDLESKGVLRTIQETTNLAVNDDPNDILAAECIRTFSSQDFPASLLLRREEAEMYGRALLHCV